MVDLRAYVFLDSLQPQFASFQATISAPGMAINHILDVALKATDVTPGMQIVERHYGMLELHSDSQANVRAAGQAILDALELEEKDRHKPRVVSNEVVRHLEDTQTMLINRFRHGNMILAGQTLFVLEVPVRARSRAGSVRGAGGQRSRKGGGYQYPRSTSGRQFRARLHRRRGEGCGGRARSGDAGYQGGHRQDDKEVIS